MKHLKSVCLVGIIVLYCGVFAASPAYSAGADHLRFERAAKLLRAGQYDAAISEYSYALALRGEMEKMLNSAKRAGDLKLARRLDAAYFAYFPFGEWQESDYESWTKIALENISLVPSERQAANAYRALQKRMEALDESENLFEGDTVDLDALDAAAARKTALALAFMKKFPQSRFAYSALAATTNRCYYGGNDAPLLRFLERGSKILEKHRAPLRLRILVWSEYAQLASLEQNAKDSRPAFAAYKNIRLVSTITREKEWAWIEAAKVAPPFGKFSAFDVSMRMYREYLNLHLTGDYVFQAQDAIIEMHLNRHQEAMAWRIARDFESLETKKPVTARRDFSQWFLRIAARGEYDKDSKNVLAQLQEIMIRFPRKSAAASARVLLASIYQRTSQAAQAVPLWLVVAQLTHKDVDDEYSLREAQSEAIGKLANYYQQNSDWENALKWWRGWNSASFCGNGIEEDNSANAFRIYTCLQNLGREQEALQTLEDWTFGSHIESTPEVPITLVKKYQKLGQRDVLEAKLRAALLKKKGANAAQMALFYIELLRARETKNVAALWKPFEHKSHRTLEYLSWETKYGAKFLIEVGDGAKPLLLEKAKSAPKNEDDETDDASSWACLLLARMGASEVLPILETKLKSINSAQELKYRLWALRLLNSDAAWKILDAQAASKNPKWSAMERKVTTLFPRGTEIPFLENEEQLLNSGPGLENHWKFNEYLDEN